ncbi:MAG: hypothetical protein AB7G23_20980 [Vicinamibacterales bacterium]
MPVDGRITRGDTATLDLIAQVGGNPVNLDGLTVKFTARYDPADPDAVIQKSTETGGVSVIDAVAGAIRVLIDSADTAALPNRPLYLYFDVEVSDEAGHRLTAAFGVLEMRQDVTG